MPQPSGENGPDVNGDRAASEDPPRVLVLGTGTAGIAPFLSDAGYIVEARPGSGALAPDAIHSCDAVVLDMTPGGIDRGTAAAFSARLADTPEASTRPFVLGVTADGSPPRDGRILADVWISPSREEVAGRAIEGAVAIRRLARARREITQLRTAVMHARTTAHDLAQPLTTVLARSQLLLRHATPDGPDHKALTIICREADRLARTMERFQTLKELAPDPDPEDS